MEYCTWSWRMRMPGPHIRLPSGKTRNHMLLCPPASSVTVTPLAMRQSARGTSPCQTRPTMFDGR
ncbi:hypothetical protein ACFV27_33785 [Streptomyces antimycoticus]|uniref:hypothetical protein n=1 Tax=Streptomyces antimycoticus TaxID=68175 RepID=UPI00191B94D3